jgi:hypothetical protein
MKARGRPGVAELLVVQNVVDRQERVRVPDDLTRYEGEVWVSVVNSEPADWFTPATIPLLTQYCRHTIYARQNAEMIERCRENAESTWYEMEKLLNMQVKQSAILVTLATNMRLSQQSTTNHRGNRKPRASTKLWD